MEQVSIEKIIGSQLVKKFPPVLWKQKVHCRIRKSPLPVPITNQIDPVYALPIPLVEDPF
jgi:hypothetical protein